MHRLQRRQQGGSPIQRQAAERVAQRLVRVRVELEELLPLGAKAPVATLGGIVVEAAAGPEQRTDSDRDLRQR